MKAGSEKQGTRGKWACAILCAAIITLWFQPAVSAAAGNAVKESLSELNRLLPPKKTVSAAWGRDPFIPYAVSDSSRPSNVKLTAIIYNENKPSAILNNRIVYIGDIVEGQKVIDIAKQYVILRWSGGSYKLEMDNASGKQYDIRKNP